MRGERYVCRNAGGQKFAFDSESGDIAAAISQSAVEDRFHRSPVPEIMIFSGVHAQTTDSIVV
jgi:hypothetical protein